MKYIRTKDNIYEVKSYHDYDLSGRLYETTDGHSIDTIEVIEVGDSIEELCDEFIGVSKIDETDHYFFASRRIIRIEEGMNVYGAIWIDWGLKYVAKLNDKGEWELL